MPQSKCGALPLGYGAIVSNLNGGRGWIRTIEPEGTDLQSAAFSHFATSPNKWCRNQDLNPEPTDYKSVALPIELFRHINKMVGDIGLEPMTPCL